MHIIEKQLNGGNILEHSLKAPTSTDMQVHIMRTSTSNQPLILILFKIVTVHGLLQVLQKG